VEDASLRGFMTFMALLGMGACVGGIGLLVTVGVMAIKDAGLLNRDIRYGKRLVCTCCVGPDETMALPCPRHDPPIEFTP
jgi:hypothetical protein